MKTKLAAMTRIASGASATFAVWSQAGVTNGVRPIAARLKAMKPKKPIGQPLSGVHPAW